MRRFDHSRLLTSGKVIILLALAAVVAGCQTTASVSPAAGDRLSAAGFESRVTQPDTLAFVCSKQRCGEVAVLVKGVETANTRVYGGFTFEAMIRSGKATNAAVFAAVGENVERDVRQQSGNVKLTRLVQFSNAQRAGMDIDFVGTTHEGGKSMVSST